MKIYRAKFDISNIPVASIWRACNQSLKVAGNLDPTLRGILCMDFSEYFKKHHKLFNGSSVYEKLSLIRIEKTFLSEISKDAFIQEIYDLGLSVSNRVIGQEAVYSEMMTMDTSDLYLWLLQSQFFNIDLKSKSSARIYVINLKDFTNALLEKQCESEKES